MSQKGLVHLVLITTTLLILAGIGIAVYLTQFTQVFKPYASESDNLNLPAGYTEFSFDPLIRKKCFLTGGPDFDKRAYEPKDQTDCSGILLNTDGSPANPENMNRWLIGFHAAIPNPKRGQTKPDGTKEPDEFPCPALYNLTAEGNQVKMNWLREADGSYAVQFHTDFANNVHPCGGGIFNWISLQDSGRTSYPNPFDTITDFDFWFDQWLIEPQAANRVILAWQGAYIDVNNKQRIVSIELNLFPKNFDTVSGDPRVVVYVNNWLGTDTGEGIEVLGLNGEKLGFPLLKLGQDNHYRVNWGEILNTFIADGRYLTAPKDKKQARTTSMFIGLEPMNFSATNSLVTDLRIKSFHIYGPASQLPIPTATITASPNPCILNSTGTCTSKISWTSENAPNLRIKHKEAGIWVGEGANGSFNATNWITASGVTFEAYSGNNLLTSLVVTGTKKIGDLSGDGNVDFADFNAFARNYRDKDLISDFNGNGEVDLADLNIMIRNFGK